MQQVRAVLVGILAWPGLLTCGQVRCNWAREAGHGTLVLGLPPELAARGGALLWQRQGTRLPREGRHDCRVSSGQS